MIRSGMLLKKVMSEPQLLQMGKQSLNIKLGGLEEKRPLIATTRQLINDIISGVSASEFPRIFTCTSAKVAWDTLQTVHDGTDTVKQAKLQNLITAFETLRMKDTKTFDELYAKLSDIVKSSFNLGEPIAEVRIIKKILQSLPERFRPKVVVIEECQNLNTLTIEKLVGNLQTFDANHCSTKEAKDIALMSSKSVEDDSKVLSDCESDDAEFEAFFV